MVSDDKIDNRKNIDSDKNKSTILFNMVSIMYLLAYSRDRQSLVFGCLYLLESHLCRS